MNKIGLILAKTPSYSETFFRSKLNGLTDAGFDVTLFASKAKDFDQSIIPGVKVEEPYVVTQNQILQVLLTFGVIVKTFFQSPKSVLRFIRMEKSDGKSLTEITKLIYINAHILHKNLDWLHFGFATMGIGRENVAEAIKAKSAVSFRGYDISIYPIIHPGCYNKLFNSIDKVHSISDDLYNEAVELGLSKDIPYTKITPAIDCGRFNLKATEKNDILTFVSVGRLTWKKGFDYSIQALSMLDVDFRYYIIGDGEDLERLKYASYQLGIEDKVVFTGKKSADEVMEYLSKCDIYLQPSVQEGFCNSVLEAQACGALCIVSDAEGLPENVEDGKSGFVVVKRDSFAIADKIKYVLEMPKSQKDEMIRYASNRVEREFNINDQIKSFIKFYAI